MIWFDGKCEPLKKRSWQVKQDVFIGRGEIPTPEQEIPGKADDRAWESCMTTSWQWSYQPNADVRTAAEVIRNLIHIRARGGNMLLNVGPRPDGRSPRPDEALLRELGLWMRLYGEAVRGVRPWIDDQRGRRLADDPPVRRDGLRLRRSALRSQGDQDRGRRPLHPEVGQEPAPAPRSPF